MDPFPDLHHLSDEELDASLAALEQEETACSLQRRMLHGRIDLLRPVLVNRLRDELASGNVPGLPEGQPGRQLYDGHGLDAPDDELGPMPDVDAMTTDELRSTSASSSGRRTTSLCAAGSCRARSTSSGRSGRDASGGAGREPGGSR